ncbi:hypothetical protein TWF481_009093 [Arthrobotrys musiformis]|uniref:Uncharacterized protein n=1 Tax=Arthrobotrys musiformis TaxID=47236 RepID=A0AAV9W4X8_9PEZI
MIAGMLNYSDKSQKGTSDVGVKDELEGGIHLDPESAPKNDLFDRNIGSGYSQATREISTRGLERRQRLQRQSMRDHASGSPPPDPASRRKPGQITTESLTSRGYGQELKSYDKTSAPPSPSEIGTYTPEGDDELPSHIRSDDTRANVASSPKLGSKRPASENASATTLADSCSYQNSSQSRSRGYSQRSTSEGKDALNQVPQHQNPHQNHTLALRMANNEISRLRLELDKATDAHLAALKRKSAQEDENERFRARMQQKHSDLQYALEESYRSETRLMSELQSLKKKYQNTEEEIGKLQRTELAKLHRRDIYMDETAQDALRDCVHTKIEAISRQSFRKISWKDVEAKLAATGVDVNISFPEHIAQYSDWPTNMWQKIRNSPDFNLCIIADALIYRILTKEFFKNPFFRAGESPELKEMLGHVYLQGLEVNITAAKVWKAKTAGLFKEIEASNLKNQALTTPPDGQRVLPPDLATVAARIQGFLIDAVNLRPGNPASDIEASRLRGKVDELVAASAHLAEDWHSREFRFEVIDLDWLGGHKIEWGSENAGKYLQPLGNRNMEENTRYQVTAVIVPGFIRYERGDVEGSEIEVVWEKASVLLSEVLPYEIAPPIQQKYGKFDPDERMGGVN